jgi:hypothetical protein
LKSKSPIACGLPVGYLLAGLDRALQEERNVRLRLQKTLEALENGVPLTLSVRIHVRGTDAWIWEDSVVDARLRYAIRYKPLSDQYEVYRLPGTEGRRFVTRDAAIASLGEIRDLQLVGADRLEPGADYEVQIKVELDVEELPLPLRPMAYLTPAWKLSSSWSKWPLKP